jgi:hypothetical protein
MVKQYPDFWHIIIGNGSAGAFLAYVFIAFVCAAVSVLIESSNRDIASTNTPVKFSLTFLFAANVKRFVANVLLIPIAVRLVYQYVPLEAMILLSTGIGFGVDRLAMMAKNLGILTTNKLAAQVAEKLAPTDPVVTPKP